MSTNQLPPLPEPYTSQRSALTNPHREKLFTIAQMHAYALAALAQQAQEPVAWLYVDTVGERYLCFSRPTGGGSITNLYATPPAPQVPEFIQAITDPENQPSQFGTVTLDFHFAKIKEWEDKFDRLFELHTSRQAAPQVPAPVDERKAFEAWMIHQGYGPKPRICSKGSPCEGEYANQFWELAYRAARAALYQPAPSPQAPGRRKGPPGITLEPQGHEQPAVPVVSDERLLREWDRVSHIAEAGSRRLAFARAILALRPATLSAEFDVRNIMLDVVPGDGSGFEVYAKNVGDVERALAEMDEKLETLEGVQNTRPAVEPMTLEQINEMALQEEFLLVCDGVEELTEIVRAVEAHHNITAKAEGGAVDATHQPTKEAE